ncbi:MAG: hypothetical protein MR304_06595 [Eubacterium sp.]|nr:hypothetical protein [Eubacterium sp.]
MKVQEAIAKADRLRPNQYSDMEKLEWLSQLDGQVFDEVIRKAEGNEEITFEGYDEESMNETLLIDDRYAKAYIDYLLAQIDFYNREIGMYNNEITLFSSIYQDYKNWYIRNHMPVQPKRTGV